MKVLVRQISLTRRFLTAVKVPTRRLWTHPSSGTSSVAPAGTVSIKNVKVDQENRQVDVAFSDSTHIRVPVSWFTDSCRCDQCYDESHHFRRLAYPIPPGGREGQVGVQLSNDGRRLTIHANSPANRHHSPTVEVGMLAELKSQLRPADVTRRKRSEISLWKGSPGGSGMDAASVLDRSQATVPYSDFITADSYRGLRDGLEKFRRFGFLIVGECPLEANVVPDLAARMAYIRESSFGQVADVRMGPQSAIHPSYRGEPLSLHTDLTYREKSPGILMLHFLRVADPETVGPDRAGGETQLSDGYTAAYQLQEQYPEHFRTLTRVFVPFAYRDPLSGLIYRNEQPTIKLAADGDQELVHEIYYSNFARQPQLTTGVPEISLSEFYTALETFSRLLVANQTQFFARSGDTLVLNNRRVLHARTAFDATQVERYMRTCYMDLDEVEAKADLLLSV